MKKSQKKGALVIVDGLDGSGKGTIVYYLGIWARRHKLKVLDLRQYGHQYHSLPDPADLEKYDVILSAEPTYSLIGRAIREELIKDNKRDYSAHATAQAFALDRYILYQRIIIPALKRGMIIFQERGVTTSIAYQPLQAEPIYLPEILSYEGNKLALKYRPDLLIITKLPAQLVINRLNNRLAKRDDAIFENLPFLKKAARYFNSAWFRKIFEKEGSQVVYVDASKDIEHGVNQALKYWKEFLAKR